MKNRLDNAFEGGKKAFIPYITAGHPSVEATVGIMNLLVENGADIIELGFPFSDPTADGPVIQASSFHALQNGLHRQDYFDIIREFRRGNTTTPVVVFTYYNPVFNMGVEAFAKTAKEAGADAVLAVDVAFEEQKEIRPILDDHELHLIQLIAPTTPEARARKILANASGFVYQIARRGVTGARAELPPEAMELVERTRSYTDVPVALGFGVSSGEQAKIVAKASDGVIVGSALVRVITDNMDSYHEPLASLVDELASATHSVS